ncbi:PASTA domain-containing protein [Hyunsoonleella sp. SJ7]|uniref:PASTA domain-containing protein n=1 Tax=Hyunsoonleella aquatilis TaxID=2762758 RepID=A0A923HC73_9FLAO|nr:PASTA domain-containing protein [Hyunsoonleella aquatilis]MBC3757378.1 PASTA domain-containing protein [Hyunsoonleella aquatilis]
MSFFKFLFSKTFLKQLGLAIVALVVLCFIMLKWLKSTTNHGEFETVPDLTGKSLSVAEIELDENNLVMQIQDSANFNPDYPKFSVIEQEPVAGTKVKEDRKIYLTLNPSGYRKVEVPDLKERTFRQAKPHLEALGFSVGKITYVDNLGKDIVLQLKYDGKTLNPGEKLSKTSKIDVVLGNGRRP